MVYLICMQYCHVDKLQRDATPFVASPMKNEINGSNCKLKQASRPLTNLQQYSVTLAKGRGETEKERIRSEKTKSFAENIFAVLLLLGLGDCNLNKENWLPNLEFGMLPLMQIIPLFCSKRISIKSSFNISFPLEFIQP